MAFRLTHIHIHVMCPCTKKNVEHQKPLGARAITFEAGTKIISAPTSAVFLRETGLGKCHRRSPQLKREYNLQQVRPKVMFEIPQTGQFTNKLVVKCEANFPQRNAPPQKISLYIVSTPTYVCYVNWYTHLKP